MKKFRVCFVVGADRLETVISVLSREVTSLSVDEVGSKRGVGDRPDRWTMGPARAVLEYMKKKPSEVYHYQDIGKEMVKLKEIGKVTSIPGVLSVLVVAGKIRRIGRGKYVVVVP